MDRRYFQNKAQIDTENCFIAKYLFKTETAKDAKPEDIVQVVPLEQSVGVCSELKHVKWKDIRKHAAYIIDYSMETENVGEMTVAYPIDEIDVNFGSIPQLMNFLAGDAFGNTFLTALRLQDIELPEKFIEKFKGPRHGIEGIRKMLEVKGRPLIGYIPKPNIGLNAEKYAEICHDAAIGGVDFIKDDQELVNPPYCTFEDRLSSVMRMLDKAETETGYKTLYAINVTDRPDRVIQKAVSAKERGANALTISAISVGLSIIEALAENPKIGLPIHVNRCTHATFTRNSTHGISYSVLSKLFRLLGADSAHIGSPVPIHFGEEVQRYKSILTSPWGKIKATMPVSTGGVDPFFTEEALSQFGKDFIIIATGAINYHPDGVRAGAEMMRMSLDFALEGKDFDEVVKNSSIAKKYHEWIMKMKTEHPANSKMLIW